MMMVPPMSSSGDETGVELVIMEDWVSTCRNVEIMRVKCRSVKIQDRMFEAAMDIKLGFA